MNKVFLGGTCADTTWRDELIPKLKVDYFNPVVENWTPEDQQKEYDEKEKYCNIHFYCLTKEMKGVFSVAEAVDSVYQKDKTTVLQVMPKGFEDFQVKSLQATVDLITKRGGIAYISDDIEVAALILNGIK